MKTVYVLTTEYEPWLENPLPTLRTYRLEAFAGWSTKGGASPPLYRTRSGTVHVLSSDLWTEHDVQLYSDMLALEVTRVELPDEEADEIIAHVDRNVINRTPSE